MATGIGGETGMTTGMREVQRWQLEQEGGQEWGKDLNGNRGWKLELGDPGTRGRDTGFVHF